MRAYCPYSPMVGTGWLEGWRLTFAGEDVLGWEGSVTTIVESPGDRVFVALYDVHPNDEKQLDEVEGALAGTYQKLHLRVATLDGDVHRLGLRLQRVRGRPADGLVSHRDRQRGGEGRCARRLSRRVAGPSHEDRDALVHGFAVV